MVFRGDAYLRNIWCQRETLHICNDLPTRAIAKLVRISLDA
jgi:hypothetical protein